MRFLRIILYPLLNNIRRTTCVVRYATNESHSIHKILNPCCFTQTCMSSSCIFRWRYAIDHITGYWYAGLWDIYSICCLLRAIGDCR